MADITLTPAQARTMDVAAQGGQSMAERIMETAPPPVAPTAEQQQQQQQVQPAEPPKVTAPDENGLTDFEEAFNKAQEEDKKKLPQLQEQEQKKTEEPSVEKKDPEPPKAEEPSLDFTPQSQPKRSQWDELKAKHATEKAELERQLSELKARSEVSPPLAEVEAMRKELDQYRQITRDIAIEKDPAFVAKFDGRKKALVDQAKLAAGEKGDVVEKLLNSPDSAFRDEQLNNLLSEMSPSAQRKINGALTVLDQIDMEKTAEIAHQRADWDARQATYNSEQEKLKAERAQEMSNAFNSTVKNWSDNGMSFYQKREGDDDHNTVVDTTIELAKNIFEGNLSAEQLAAASLWAASGSRILNGLIEARKEIETLKASNDKIRGVQPGAGKEPKSADHVSDSIPPPGTPAYEDYWRKELSAAQATDRGRATVY